MEDKSENPFTKDEGKDFLRYFYNRLEENSKTTFGLFDHYIKIILRLINAYELHYRDLFSNNFEQTAAILLFVRMQSATLAATRLATSGQMYESTVLIRSVLECGTYAWYCSQSSETSSIWSNRATSADSRKTARQHFAWTKIIDALHASDEELAADVEAAYDDAIDAGAHPNVEGVKATTQIIEKKETHTEIISFYAHTDASAYGAGLIDVINTIFIGTRLLHRAFPQRVKDSGLDVVWSSILTDYLAIIIGQFNKHKDDPVARKTMVEVQRQAIDNSTANEAKRANRKKQVRK